MGGRERSIGHYSSSHKILLVGEGDFSFSACLARAFGSAENMVATSLDSKDQLATKHWSAAAHLEELAALGCTVIHNVNVNNMHERRLLKQKRFDRIIFNFPHAGHDPLYCERDIELISKHKKLLKAFFGSARKLLTEGGDTGEVHVLHRNDYPYNQWKLEKLARKAGLVLLEMVEFEKGDYPGYHNKRGGWIRSNKTFPIGEAFVFKFSLYKRLQTHQDDLARILANLHV